MYESDSTYSAQLGVKEIPICECIEEGKYICHILYNQINLGNNILYNLLDQGNELIEKSKTY